MTQSNNNNNNTNNNIHIPVALGLGFFDSVHIGHRMIVDRLKEYALTHSCVPACITFSDVPSSKMRLVYNFEDRRRVLVQSGVDIVYAYEFAKIKDLSPLEFLNNLVSNMNIQLIVCGLDFRFGKDASGDIVLLQEFCSQKGIKCSIVDTCMVDGIKVSSTNIAALLKHGDIQLANTLLGTPYTISGTVVHGKGIGHTIAPTINLIPKSDTQQLADGVYGTYTLLGDTWHKSVTNIGCQPTVGCEQCYIETHIMNYSGDLYGKEVIIRFEKKIRDVMKFDGIGSLKAQIEIDKLWM